MDPSIDPSTLPHDSRAKVIIGVDVLVCSVATIAVALRIYTRAFMIKHIGVDDYMCMVALFIAIATGISQAYHTRIGLGKHSWDLDGPVGVRNYLQNFHISIALYNSGLLFVKLTFLTQYYRVLAVKKMRLICIVAMIIIGSWSLSQVLVGVFMCNPVAGFWDASLNAKCIPNIPQWYINSAGNIATDITIFILPMPALCHLKLPRLQRNILLGIFSLGFFTCAISVIRIKYLKQGGDFSYENVDGSAWSITELCSGVTCASLTTLRPIVSKWVPGLSTRIHKSDISHRRRSGTVVGVDIEGASGHTRKTSRTSNSIMIIDSKEELHHSKNSYDIRRSQSRSGSVSEEILGLKSAKRALYGDEPSLRSPQSVRFSLTSHKTFGDDEYYQPSVTTEGGTSNSQSPEWERNEHKSAIRARHDLALRQSQVSLLSQTLSQGSTLR